MRALSKVQPCFNGLEIVSKEIREPQPDEMLLKVNVAGVCGTDMQVFHGAGAFAQRVKLPTVLGHEMCGTVVSVGAHVTRVKPGDLVSLESHIPCWECKACRTGRSHVCLNTRYPGIDLDGTFAEFITVPASIAWVNPTGTDKRMAALLEPLGIAVHASLEGRGMAGQTVVVNGCGPIGLMNVATARHFGAHKIIAIDPNPLRRAMAETMGADMTLDAGDSELIRKVRQYSGGDGTDVVIEYTGSAEGARNCFAMVAPLGDIRWCATPSKPIEFDFGVWRKGRPTIYNIHGRRIWETWEIAAPLVYDRKIDLSPVISHEIPLADGIDAFELIVAGQAVKPLILCD